MIEDIFITQPYFAGKMSVFLQTFSKVDNKVRKQKWLIIER